MNIYPILVFIHVLGAVGLFAALGMELIGMGRLRAAETTGEIRASLAPLAVPRRLGPTALGIAVATGVWMMIRWWRGQSWTAAALVLVVVVAVGGAVLMKRGMQRLGRALAPGSETSAVDVLRSPETARALNTAIGLRLWGGIGLVALMTLKPALAVSTIITVASLGAAVVAGRRPVPVPALAKSAVVPGGETVAP